MDSLPLLKDVGLGTSDVKVEVKRDLLRELEEASARISEKVSGERPRYRLNRPERSEIKVRERPNHNSRKLETLESDSYSGDDELEAKLKKAIDKSRSALKERKKYNAGHPFEKHKREASKSAVYDLCSCISDFIVESAMMTSESARTARLCEKLQNANELIDAERLAIEFQMYEKETELEEIHFKYVEIKEKYDLQEDLHLKEQRALETASQELKIKYEKHFKSLSSEIVNLTEMVAEKINVIADLQAKGDSPAKAQSPQYRSSDRDLVLESSLSEENPVFAMRSNSMPSVSGLTSNKKQQSPNWSKLRTYNRTASTFYSANNTPKQYGGDGLSRYQDWCLSTSKKSSISMVDRVFTSPFRSSSSFSDRIGASSPTSNLDYDYGGRSKSEQLYHKSRI